MDVLLVNGPNLNALGTRRPDVYGSTTLADVELAFRQRADEHGLTSDCFQSNHEGGILDRLYSAKADGCKYVVINPGAYTHTSIAIRDAFEAIDVPFIEVHISNVHAREKFRHHSHLSAIAAGVLIGCGTMGYSLALDLAAHRIAPARD